MAIKITNVKKSFKDDHVLNGISLSVNRGETLVLFGPSGAGKTVLLRLIAGVIDPDEGIIEVNGCDMNGVEAEDRGIGMAFQNFALFPHMDAYENIASPLTARRKSKADIKTEVEKVAVLLKIDHVLDHKPKELSNGEKQRTALARALVGQPSVLLLDDPLRNVDAKLRYEMRLELPRLLKNQNATVIYVTQDYKEAMALGDNIAVMNDCGILQVGTPEDIYLRPRNIEIARLFGDPAINLLDVCPERGDAGVQLRLSNQSVVINSGYSPVIEHDCILGIRPEALHFVNQDSPGSFPVTVGVEASLNEKTVNLTFTAQGREIMISRPAGSPGTDQGKACVAIDVHNLLLFDRQTGDRIKPTVTTRQGEVA